MGEFDNPNLQKELAKFNRELTKEVSINPRSKLRQDDPFVEYNLDGKIGRVEVSKPFLNEDNDDGNRVVRIIDKAKKSANSENKPSTPEMYVIWPDGRVEFRPKNKNLTQLDVQKMQDLAHKILKGK